MIDGGWGRESPISGAKRRLVVPTLRFGIIFKFISLRVRMPKLALATVRGDASHLKGGILQERKWPNRTEEEE